MARRHRPDEQKAIRKSVSLPAALVAGIERRAIEEEHRNFSAVVVKAVRRYLARPAIATPAGTPGTQQPSSHPDPAGEPAPAPLSPHTEAAR